MMKGSREMERSMACAFTGHRENKLPWGADERDDRCMALKQRIYDAAASVYRSGVRHFICGMATGCDMYFCEAVLELRAQFPDVMLEAAIPWEGQSSQWRDTLRRRYNRLVTECDYQTVISSTYTADCMKRRNCYMVDSAGVLIAAYNGRPGGTMQTLLYAIRQGVEIIELPIDD